ncbi:MAG: transketolase C-terminal domain-containing protein [Longicatena sp.]
MIELTKDIEDLKVTYANLLIESAKNNENIVIVEADLMKSCGIDRFRDLYPDRTFDVGVAEANMISMAAGLANMGKIPFTQTFAIFASHRCLDQINLSVAYAGMNVKMCGSDPGITTELNGGTHECMDDLGIMRAIPTMTVFEPVDCISLKKMFPQLLLHKGPVYIRLLRGRCEKVYEEDSEIVLGKGNIIKKGKDVSIFATGIMLSETIKAVNILEKEGIDAEVINIHTIKPLDIELIVNSVQRTGCAVTAENGTVYNGLGSAVCEVVSEHYPCPVKRIGVQDHFGEIGHVDELKVKMNMSANDIVKAVKAVIKKKDR